MARDGMQVERAMRLVPVQEHRDAHDRDVGKPQSYQGDAPPRKIKNT
jgi:hypothetical protein